MPNILTEGANNIAQLNRFGGVGATVKVIDLLRLGFHPAHTSSAEEF